MAPRIGQTIKGAMAILGWRNQELSDALGEQGVNLSANALSKVINGDRQVTFEEVAAISRALNVPMDWLRDGPDWFDAAASHLGGYPHSARIAYLEFPQPLISLLSVRPA